MLEELDWVVGSLMEEIEARKLPVNMVVVSDHGMATVDPEDHIRIDGILPKWREMIEWIDFGPVTSIWPKEESADAVYEALSAAAAGEHYRVYKRGEFPAEWNYDRMDSTRIPPLVILCEVGYVMDFEKAKPVDIFGYHGYDPESAEMRAIFLARGPDITRELLVRDPVLNVDLYPLMTRLLQIDSVTKAVNGTDYLANIVMG